MFIGDWTIRSDPDLPAPYSQKAEVIEVIDPMGNHALIKIWLIQLGVKPVIRCDPHDGQVTTDATVSIQIKVYSELVDPKNLEGCLELPRENNSEAPLV